MYGTFPVKEYALQRIDYVVKDGIPNILLFARDKDKNLMTFSYPYTPYFYIPEECSISEDLKKYVLREEGRYTAFDGKIVKKVYVNVCNGNLTKIMDILRKSVERTYESRIFLTRRFLIDMEIKSSFVFNEQTGNLYPFEGTTYIPPKICYIDIEADIVGEIDMDNPKPITCITMYDSYNKQFTTLIWHKSYSPPSIENIALNVAGKQYITRVYKFNDEVNMLNYFINYMCLQNFDVITGWNAVGVFDVYRRRFKQGFDLPYIIQRCRMLKLPIERLSPLHQVFVDDKTKLPVIRAVNVIDLLYAFQFVYQSRYNLLRWSLDYVAEKLLNLEPSSIEHTIWKENPDKLLEKNFYDTIRIVLLDEKYQIIEYFDKIRREVGCLLDDVFYDTRIFTILSLRQKAPPLPDKLIIEEEYDYKGAYVKEPEVGLFRNVANYDISMTYPTTISALNISPETITDIKEGVVRGYVPVVLYDKEGKEIIKSVKFKETKGILPTIAKQLIEIRKDLKEKYKKEKDEEQKKILNMKNQAFKFILNGMYGVVGSKNFALFNPYVAGAVTGAVREILQNVIEKCNTDGYKVLYSDTDSIYIVVSTFEEAKEVERKLNNFIAEFMKNEWNTKESLTIELNKYYNWCIFLEKQTEEEGSKKNIIGKTKEGEIEVVGKMLRETSYSELSIKLQYDIINLIDKYNSDEELLKQKIVETLNNYINNFDKITTEEIAIPRATHKTNQEYKSRPAVLRGIENSIKLLGHPKVELGTKLKYVYTTSVDNRPTDILAWEDSKYLSGHKIKINKQKMIELTIKKAIENILKIFNIKYELVRGSKQQLLTEWI